jgi:menaquinone-specific isochorismate synthase
MARTRRVEAPLPLAGRAGRGFVWWRDGRGLVTEGVAARVPVPDVGRALRAVEVDGVSRPPGAGPIAVGALPFDPAATSGAEMVVPARHWTRDEAGGTWLTEVAGAPDLGDVGPPPGPGCGPGEGIGGRQEMSRSDWTAAVAAALARIGAGQVQKVVLARQVRLTARSEIDVGELVQRLAASQPRCYVFADGGFVGATPEALVARRGDRVTSRPMAGTAANRPMAGTAARGGGGAVFSLAGSPKNRWEHALVVDAVVSGLARWCREPPVARQPEVDAFADVAHIATGVEGRLRLPWPSALELALALHPTPAVAGVPTDEALVLIGSLERAPRGRYGGPVGWVDANGDGEFALSLRCAEVRGNQAVLYAGAGIVAGSTWEEEWSETEAKLAPMRRVLAGR